MCKALAQARDLASEGKNVEEIDLAVGSSAFESPRWKFRYSLGGTKVRRRWGALAEAAAMKESAVRTLPVCASVRLVFLPGVLPDGHELHAPPDTHGGH